MVGSSQTDLPSVTDPRTWESTHRILSPIRPHGLGEHRRTRSRQVRFMTSDGLLPVPYPAAIPAEAYRDADLPNDHLHLNLDCVWPRARDGRPGSSRRQGS